MGLISFRTMKKQECRVATAVSVEFPGRLFDRHSFGLDEFTDPTGNKEALIVSATAFSCKTNRIPTRDRALALT